MGGRNRVSIEEQPDSTVSAEEKSMLFGELNLYAIYPSRQYLDAKIKTWVEYLKKLVAGNSGGAPD